jgi:ribosomal-protein-alanine N-acetyltransferase
VKVIRTDPSHALILANYYSVNSDLLQQWSPAVPREHHSIESWKRRLLMREAEFENGSAVHFIGTDDSQSHVIGTCSLSNIVRGVFMACHIGYSCAERYEGQGFMKKIVRHVVGYSFDELRLHRIMANYMPVNSRSGGLLKNLGFQQEGLAKEYLLINGKWEDHVLTSLLNPKRSP